MGTNNFLFSFPAQFPRYCVLSGELIVTIGLPNRRNNIIPRVEIDHHNHHVNSHTKIYCATTALLYMFIGTYWSCVVVQMFNGQDNCWFDSRPVKRLFYKNILIYWDYMINIVLTFRCLTIKKRLRRKSTIINYTNEYESARFRVTCHLQKKKRNTTKSVFLLLNQLKYRMRCNISDLDVSFVCRRGGQHAQ